MIEDTLKELSEWFENCGEGQARPKLLSKLALLELCGWLESEFDRLVMLAEIGRLDDPEWVKKNVVDRTYGMDYGDHFRPMMCKVVGEVHVRRIEARCDALLPNGTADIKSLLSMLWLNRCKLAHGHYDGQVVQQQLYQAPSWVRQQHKKLKKMLGTFEQALVQELGTIPAA